jgi:hypothetical protein
MKVAVVRIFERVFIGKSSREGRWQLACVVWTSWGGCWVVAGGLSAVAGLWL